MQACHEPMTFLSPTVKQSAKKDNEGFIHVCGICSEVEKNRNSKTTAAYEGIRRITQTHAPGLGTVRDDDGNIWRRFPIVPVEGNKALWLSEDDSKNTRDSVHVHRCMYL